MYVCTHVQRGRKAERRGFSPKDTKVQQGTKETETNSFLLGGLMWFCYFLSFIL
jgi:hypothetical protein